MMHRKERGNYKTLEGKRLLKIQERLNHLYSINKNPIEYVPINPPIRVGWKRTYVLREDIRKRKDAKFIAEALALVNYEQYSKRKDFKDHSWENRHIWKEMEFPFKDLSEREYLKLSEKMRNCFYKTIKVPRWGAAYEVYKFDLDPWMFKKKVSPRYINQRAIYDTNVESEIDKLWNYLYRSGRSAILYHYLGDKKNYWDDWDMNPRELYESILDEEARDIFLSAKYNIKEEEEEDYDMDMYDFFPSDKNCHKILDKLNEKGYYKN
jgi:hypothetical protein